MCVASVGFAVTMNRCFSPVFQLYTKWLWPPVPSLPKSPLETPSPLATSLTRFSSPTLERLTPSPPLSHTEKMMRRSVGL